MVIAALEIQRMRDIFKWTKSFLILVIFLTIYNIIVYKCAYILETITCLNILIFNSDIEDVMHCGSYLLNGFGYLKDRNSMKLYAYIDYNIQ